MDITVYTPIIIQSRGEIPAGADGAVEIGVNDLMNLGKFLCNRKYYESLKI